MQKINLYIHIPFCQQKCAYCAFFSNANQNKYFVDYFTALKAEVLGYQQKLSNYEVQTIYIGGGTPSLVDAEYIVDLITYIKFKLNLSENIEITIESNPESLDKYKLEQYLSIGINRLSVGVQAFQDRLLKKMGRLYDAKLVPEVVNMAKDVGFKNINIDLIFGLPRQSIQDWEETLEQSFQLETQHISCYSLELDNSSLWGQLHKKGDFQITPDKIDRQMYDLIKVESKKNNFNHYEISNFAKDNFQCTHNLDFWHCQDYLGLGAGAHSFFEGNRFNNIYNVGGYINNQNNNTTIIQNVENTTKDTQMREYLAFGLRLIDGLDIKVFENKFNISINSFSKEVDELIKLGLIVKENMRLLPTSTGLDLWNKVFIILLN